MVDVEPSIAIQTVAELRFGALAARWGQRRMVRLADLIARARVIPVDDEIVWAHARLRVACQRIGHPLHNSAHDGDLWIAASAVTHDLALVSDDAIFAGVRGLTVITA